MELELTGCWLEEVISSLSWGLVIPPGLEDSERSRTSLQNTCNKERDNRFDPSFRVKEKVHFIH